jgi:hypothetical protein
LRWRLGAAAIPKDPICSSRPLRSTCQSAFKGTLIGVPKGVRLLLDDFAVETDAVIGQESAHGDQVNQVSSVVPDPGRTDCLTSGRGKRDYHFFRAECRGSTFLPFYATERQILLIAATFG